MIEIGIDLSEALEGFPITQAEAEEMTQAAVTAASWAVYEEIRTQANQHLRSTRAAYKRNINKPIIERLKGTILLTGVLPNMVEQGASPFDMKKGFMNSAKAKKKKNGGWYFTVPFRWATPGALGESEAFSSILPPEIMDLIRENEPTRTEPNGRRQSGKGIPKSKLEGTPFGVIKERAAIVVKGKEIYGVYVHKTPLLAGLTRNEKTYEKATQSQYVTFRRVSDKSDPMSWIHRGIQAYDLFGKADSEVDYGGIVAKSINTILGRLNI